MVACGDDSTTDAGTAGTGAAGTSAGTGGASGGGGAAGKAGGGAGAAGATMCGGVACTVNSVLKSINAMAAACCTAGGKCGQYNTSMKCLEKNAVGTPDTSCPTINVVVMGQMYPQVGCCTPAKKCGGNFTQVEWGCVAREDTDMGMGGPLPPLACGSGDGGGDAGL